MKINRNRMTIEENYTAFGSDINNLPITKNLRSYVVS